MKVAWIVAGTVFASGVAGNLAAKQNSPTELIVNSTDVLKRNPGVLVLIGLGPEEVAAGLSKEGVKSQVELALRRNGVKVLSQSEYLAQPSHPWLNVFVTLNSTDFQITLAYHEDARIMRSTPTVVKGAILYDRSVFGRFDSLSYLKTSIDERVEAFALDWLKANPR
jgi:hypothetical protein